METGRRCPACGGALVPWSRAPAADAGDGRIAVARCTSCASAVTLGSAVRDAHETGDYGPGAPRGRCSSRQGCGPSIGAASLLRRAMPPPARLLDAGAGRGRFVAAARRAGYLATGIEPGARGAAAARDDYEVALGQAGVEEAEIPPASLDVVCLWHVLEHVEDPGAALRTIRAWLAPGGALLVGVPDLASWQARLAGGRWYHLDLPRHRTHFTARGLDALLEASGFTVEASTHVLAEHNPLGMWLAGVSRATRRPSYLYHLLKRNAPARSPDLLVTLAALPLLPVAAALELVAGLARRGGTVAVTARTR